MKIGILDLEANGLLDTVTKLHCGVVKDIGSGDVKKFRPNDVKALLEHLDSFDVLIAHNGIGYDWPLLKKLYGYTFKGKCVDTLLMSRLLNPKRLVPFNCPNKKAGPHSVEAWGWRVGRGKPEHNDWENFSEEMLHRCSEDVEIQHLIYNELLKEAKGKNWRDAFLLIFKLFEYLQKQEEYGWLVDKPHMERCIHQLEHWISRIDKVLEKHLPVIVEICETKKDGDFVYIKKPFLKSGEPSRSVNDWVLLNYPDGGAPPIGGPFSRVSFRKVNLNSNDETKDFLLRSGWEPLEWNTNDEGERTSPKLSKDDPFDGINGGVGRLVAKRVQCRQRKSIIEGLVAAIRPDGRIASVINSLAATGRATHRGIVNIPGIKSFYGKQMRKIFTCKKGFVLVGTDSDQCQLRMLAGRMGDPQYLEAIVNGDKSKGTDNHTMTMKICDLDSRDTAKTVIYCLVFGGQDTKLGKSAKKPGRGAEIRNLLYKKLGGLEELVKSLTNEWRQTAKKRLNAKWNRMEYYDGYITGLDGRPIHVPFEHQILVYLLQSDEAIMMAAAYNRFNMQMSRKYKYGIDYGIVAWYHDEFTCECREEIAENVAKLAEEAIAWAGRFYQIPCPHVGQAKIGRDWYSIH